MSRRGCILLLALLAMPTVPGWAQGPAPAADTLRLKFLDVGQADAVLIQVGRRAILVDASRGDDIVQYLEEEGVDSLVAAIASHNHEDHIGGMDAVLADWPVERYLANGRPPINQAGREVQRLLAERAVPAPPPPWPVIRIGDVRVTVFPSVLMDSSETENNFSLGVMVERGRFKALLTGDSQSEELGAWLEHRRIPDVDVLKAAHHGARDGLIPGWLDATRPEVVVISVGRNGYGHPDPWALRYYRTHQRRVLRTDVDGTVVIAVDSAGNYSLETRGPLPR